MSSDHVLRREVADIWHKIFGVAVGDGEDDLFAVGGTSLQAVQLMTRIEEEFGVKISLPVIYAEGSINRLTELVEEELLASVGDLSEEETLRLLDDQQQCGSGDLA